MINESLMNPESILVVGGSEDTSKPGGKIVQNILDGGFTGQLYVLNPGRDVVQGVPAYIAVNDIPGRVDLAILAISAKQCVSVVTALGQLKNTRAFIVISAGFSEEGEEGGKLETALREAVDDIGGVLIGPNCIGMITPAYNGVFTSPVPKLDPAGCDFVSGSGSTAVFILESALPKGLTFSSLISVGNSAQVGIEEVLEYWDKTYEPGKSADIKLIYVENISCPDKLLKHASSLISKGCRIAAIKSGVTDAGGAGVMLTDALTGGGLNIPRIEGKCHNDILNLLNPGASASNPIDILATGTAHQMSQVIAYCDRKMDHIHGMIVIFGSTGLSRVFDAYETIHEQMRQCQKPVFPILPSISSARDEVEFFLAHGHINFPDEVVLGRALTSVSHTPAPAKAEIFTDKIDVSGIRDMIDKAPDGFLDPPIINRLLKAAGIPTVQECVASSKKELFSIAKSFGFPLAIKVIEPVHKSDVGGVTLNIKSEAHLLSEFRRMRKIKGVHSVLVQKMQTGTELFIGAKYEPRFGHVVLCGLGGIFVETLDDQSYGLAPLTFNEAYSMVRGLKSYPIIQGLRGKEGVDEDYFVEIIVRLSTLLRYATEIKELDLNPLIGNRQEIRVVDARIRVEKGVQ
jgi:acyl-CoA synthetase (NDP forming)